MNFIKHNLVSSDAGGAPAMLHCCNFTCNCWLEPGDEPLTCMNELGVWRCLTLVDCLGADDGEGCGGSGPSP